MTAKTEAKTNPDTQTNTENQANATSQANAEATRGAQPPSGLDLQAAPNPDDMAPIPTALISISDH